MSPVKVSRSRPVKNHTKSPTRGWLIDLAVGGVLGGVVGAVGAVNFVIFSGIEPGYQATIPQVFQQSLLAGIITVGLLIAGPVLGVIGARRTRRRRGYRSAE